LSRSTINDAPAEMARARWAASRTRLKRLGTFSTQSSTVRRHVADAAVAEVRQHDELLPSPLFLEYAVFGQDLNLDDVGFGRSVETQPLGDPVVQDFIRGVVLFEPAAAAVR